MKDCEFCSRDHALHATNPATGSSVEAVEVVVVKDGSRACYLWLDGKTVNPYTRVITLSNPRLLRRVAETILKHLPPKKTAKKQGRK